jgi:cytochrome c553
MRTLMTAAALVLAVAPFAASAQQQPPSQKSVRDTAATCAICHGLTGMAPTGMPVLAGQSSETLLRSLRDFRDGKRPATIMHQIAKGYSDEQLQALATWFAAQKTK